jgi:hypothetical protein
LVTAKIAQFLVRPEGVETVGGSITDSPPVAHDL